MKILICNSVLAHGAFHAWAEHDLRDMGHEVETIDPDELVEQFGAELYRRILIQRIVTERPDVFLSFPPYDLLRIEDAQTINKYTRTRLVGFAYDDAIFLDSYHRSGLPQILENFSNIYDAYFTTSIEMVRQAAALGYGQTVQHVKWACPAPAPLDDVPRDLDVVLIGTAYPRRVEMVRQLQKAGVAVSVFGSDNWLQYPDVAPLYGGFLTPEGVAAVYRRAKVAIAPADWESESKPMVKLRLLEILSHGPTALHEVCEDLQSYLGGSDVVEYHFDDWFGMVNSIQAILQRPESTEATRRFEAHKWLCDNLTWKTAWPELMARVPELGLHNHRYTYSDPQLPVDMVTAAAAMHHERMAEVPTAMKLYQKWTESCPVDFTANIGLARCLFMLDRHADAVVLFRQLSMLPSGTPAMDATFSIRKLGVRLGHGRVLAGIYPRSVECLGHLFLIHALTGDGGAVQELIMSLATSSEELLFVSLLAIMNDDGLRKRLPVWAVLRFTEVMIECKPTVWAGERRRHLGHLWYIRGRAFMTAGNSGEALDCFRMALDSVPMEQVRVATVGMIAQVLQFKDRELIIEAA